MPTLTIDFVNGELTVTSDAADPIVIDCAANVVRVNGEPVARVTCGSVTAIKVLGGSGPHTIDLTGVTAAAFPNLPAGAINVSGSPEADTILASPIGGGYSGLLGNDSLDAGDGNDGITGGEGNGK